MSAQAPSLAGQMLREKVERGETTLERIADVAQASVADVCGWLGLEPPWVNAGQRALAAVEAYPEEIAEVTRVNVKTVRRWLRGEFVPRPVPRRLLAKRWPSVGVRSWDLTGAALS